MARSGEAQGQADASSQTAGGERVDKEGWGSPNTSAPVILISTGTPARVKPYSLLIIRICNNTSPTRQEH